MLKLATIVLLTTVVVAQNSSHQQGVETRGDQAMGFSHQMTTHHFGLTNDGGVIEVEADNPNDKASRDAIRQHLEHIATLFSQGDFDLPMFIHAQTPPGVPTMKRLKEQIKYETHPTAKGAEVKIATTNPEAVSASHQFLRFQIQDQHRRLNRSGPLTPIARKPPRYLG